MGSSIISGRGQASVGTAGRSRTQGPTSRAVPGALRAVQSQEESLPRYTGVLLPTPASLLALTGLSAQEMSTFPKMGQVFLFDLWFFPREAELLVFLQEVRGGYGAQWAHRAWTLPVP